MPDDRPHPDVNRLIVDKLAQFPTDVAALATKAVRLAETLPEATVVEALQNALRDCARKRGGTE